VKNPVFPNLTPDPSPETTTDPTPPPEKVRKEESDPKTENPDPGPDLTDLTDPEVTDLKVVTSVKTEKAKVDLEVELTNQKREEALDLLDLNPDLLTINMKMLFTVII